jgi:hypothetical protein
MRKLYIACILVLVMSMTSAAWNRQGHYAVASIAYSTLTKSERNEIGEILKYHPFYSQWLTEYQKYHPSMSVKEYAFIKAAGWPDDVRSRKWKKTYHHGNWHYVNFPCSPPDNLNTSDPIGSGQLMSKINDALHSLKDDTSIDQREDRAIMLAWLIHLVGDLHQPLHTVALKNDDYEDGDHGGNFFFIFPTEESYSTNLHSFWDEILGTEKSVAGGAALGATARSQLPFSSTLIKGNHHGWARESAQIGLESGYQYRSSDGSLQALEGGLSADDAVVLPTNYAGRVKKIAMKRVALAGYRLGSVIKAALH